MRTVAYLRVSTAQQDVRRQRLAILEDARQHDFPHRTTSSRRPPPGRLPKKRRRLDELLNGLQRGDRLVVSELSRLGRSLRQIVAILDALAKAGVAFVALKENIRVEGKRDIQTKVMTTLFALFAEVERDLISERTRARGPRQGQAPRARKLGRPKGSLGVSRLDGKEDESRHFLELGVSKTAIAKITGVSRTALYSFMTTTQGAQADALACIRARMFVGSVTLRRSPPQPSVTTRRSRRTSARGRALRAPAAVLLGALLQSRGAARTWFERELIRKHTRAELGGPTPLRLV